jgi:hypothetical protein
MEERLGDRGGWMNTLLGIDRIAEATPWLVESSPWREDPLAIEETIRGFFDAFNGMNYDRCLSHVAMGVDADRDRLTGLLRLARYFSGTIDVQRVTNITISDSQATAIVNAMVRGEATKEEVELLKAGTGWKLLWEGAPTRKTVEETDDNGRSEGRSSKRPKK